MRCVQRGRVHSRKLSELSQANYDTHIYLSDRGSKASRTPPSPASGPRSPSKQGGHHQQTSHRNPCPHLQISKYDGSRRSSSTPDHYTLFGLLSLASNGPRVSGTLDHNSSSRRRHPRFSARHTLLREVERCTPLRHYVNAFTRGTDIQLFLPIFISDRKPVDLRPIQMLVV
jgi:hypothetical protein